MTDQTPEQSIQSGMRLGGLLLVVFSLSAIVAYVILGALGTEGTPQLLIAALLGPVIGSGIFAVYYLIRQSGQA